MSTYLFFGRVFFCGYILPFFFNCGGQAVETRKTKGKKKGTQKNKIWKVQLAEIAIHGVQQQCCVVRGACNSYAHNFSHAFSVQALL